MDNRSYQRKHYQDNKALYADKKRRYREKRKAWLDDLKSKPCMDCGGTFPPCVMDFDHRDRSTKVGNISNLRVGKEKLLAEIAKCDLVCANCHRIRTQAPLV